jgi:hypothetical protein
LLLIRGALTAAPTKELPVNQMPQAAPTTLSPNAKATPILAYPYGLICEKTSAHPALQKMVLQAEEESPIVLFVVVVVVYKEKEEIDRLDYRDNQEETRWVLLQREDVFSVAGATQLGRQDPRCRPLCVAATEH